MTPLELSAWLTAIADSIWPDVSPEDEDRACRIWATACRLRGAS